MNMTLNMALATMPIQMGHVNTEKKKVHLQLPEKRRKKWGAYK